CYTTAAIHEASGRMAGYTTLAWAQQDPTHAWQWNTIVDAEHRGRRLGVLLKVANQAYAFEREPATRTVFTWNAESNQHMNAINTALGFAPIDRWAESQLLLG
ncbi:MAG: GNAT family N-acetyltransferase, partial [Thermocrispum sp.]